MTSRSTTRQPINDNFGDTSLRTSARGLSSTPARVALQRIQADPVARPQQIIGGDDGSDRWKALGRLLAAGETFAEDAYKRSAEEEAAKASAWANSMTVDELHKHISEGRLMPSQSPVFNATVQNIWGRNALEALERDTMSKLGTGELNFTSAKEIDAFLTESRNTTLSGRDKYAVAGFDKQYLALKDKLTRTVATMADKKAVEHGATMAVDSLANTLNKVTTPEFQSNPKGAADELLAHFDLLRKTSVLPEGAVEGALTDTLTRAAGSGHKDLVSEVLNREIPGKGTLRAIMGASRAEQLEGNAKSRYDSAQRQRVDEESLPHLMAAKEGRLDPEKFTAWATSDANKKYTSAPMIASLLVQNEDRKAQIQAETQAAIQRDILATQVEKTNRDARAQVDAAIGAGRLWEVQGNRTPQVVTDSGKIKEFDVKGYAEQSITQRTAKMPMEQQVSVWSQNGLINPDWKNQLQAGLFNLATIGVDSKGKPQGELNDAGKRAIELFKQLDAISPDAARQTAGEEAYKRFSDIDFLTKLGRQPSDAAAIAANAASGAITNSDTQGLIKKVQSQVDDLTKGPWYKPDWAASLMGDNTSANTSQVTGTLRRYATLLAHSGQYGTAEEAVSAAAAYLKNPAVSVQVNGTLYMRSELPTSPHAKESAEEWLGKYLDAVPKARAKELGFDANEVRMEYDPAAKAYRAMVAGFPLTNPEGGVMVVSRRDVEKWYREELERHITAFVDTRVYETYTTRLVKEIGQRKEEVGAVYGMAPWAYLLTREKFDRIRKDGNSKRPLKELMTLYPPGGGKAP